ncbi:superoxide dismutase [Myxococcota bacterium]|nr:superoxide dismutase [Myxococcota bacterium]
MNPTYHDYRPRDYSKVRGLKGISDPQIEQHLKLYEGYVNNLNKLLARRGEMCRAGQIGTPEFAELTRRAGFEWNGMRLHEHYFENMTPGGGGDPPSDSPLRQAIEASFGSFDAWKADFLGVGAMRGVGWAILYLDLRDQRLLNTWITLHEDGHLAGTRPILVMDVWEHAFTVDHKPTERSKYLEAFFHNVRWDACDDRLAGIPEGRPGAAAGGGAVRPPPTV